MKTNAEAASNTSRMVRAGENPDAERREKSRGHGAELCARILFAVGLPVSLCRELRGEESRIPPRHDGAESDLLHAGHLRDAANRFLVERGDLFGLPCVGHHGDIHGQHVAPEAGLLPLQREERRDEHARTREQDERRGDLRDREHAQAAIGARRDPHAAARQT